jgi:hypothetical protein
MVSLAIPKDDLKNMTYTDLNNQKSFLKQKDEKNEDVKIVDFQNLKNISTELQSRNTTYILLIGVGIVIGLVALRKLK